MPENTLQFNAPGKAATKKPTPLEQVQQKSQEADQVFPRQLHWFNMRGFIKIVTAIPSAAPKSLADSVVIYLDSLSSPTTKRLYMYSPDASSWFYVALT